MSKRLSIYFTGLPAGTYCNIIDDCGTSITVGADGRALVAFNNYEEPIFATCAGCEGGPTRGTTLPTTPGPSAPPLEGVRRTVIFILKETGPGQDMFIRGGIDAAVRPPCTDINSACSLKFTVSFTFGRIPIQKLLLLLKQINSLGASTHYDKYNGWRVGDSKLDWFGAETGQGTYTGQAPEGTPLAWTSSTSTSPGYQPLNKYYL